MSDKNLIGKRGRVTGMVRPGRFGEVMLAVGHGVEAFYAIAYDGTETIARNAECVVVAVDPSQSRTVLVTAMPACDLSST
jgi:hypothetical protein